MQRLQNQAFLFKRTLSSPNISALAPMRSELGLLNLPRHRLSQSSHDKLSTRTFQTTCDNKSVKVIPPGDIKVCFEDVKGIHEARNELQVVVDCLLNPEKFAALGGKLPRGLLLLGPPGTGKTLLARAVAGEAGVPFFSTNGSEFDVVGQGAKQVRDLFSAANEKAPCVIFIDEIDFIGSARAKKAHHPYANETITQLLTEMDGFHQNQGVIVIAATNRYEALDKALIRPGRFDVQVHVQAPDLKGRKAILEYYLGKVKRSSKLDVDAVARSTHGFTGADLENMVNQAALRAANEGAESVGMDQLEHARLKATVGVERKSTVMDDEAKLLTAYHEAGHAIVAIFTKDAPLLDKVTIIPRGKSLGHASFLPKNENLYWKRAEFLANMDVDMGGRAAEELIYGVDRVTTSSRKDLEVATSSVTQMVKTYGMSGKVGLRAHIPSQEISPATTELIDNEIKSLLQESYDRAMKILKEHQKELKALADALIKHETLTSEDVKRLLKSFQPLRDPRHSRQGFHGQ